ncbi:MAG: M56 family metallopeptidase [Muribaculaceae bacterium]|nr:M56 family metallopeptidase [Muribaculaceae bacterium]
MGTIFAYSLTSALLLATMYLVFKWMLAGENQHRYNRAILWLIYALSLTLPALIPALKHITETASHQTGIAGMEQAIEIGMPSASIAETEPLLLPRILLAIYIAGAAAAAVYTVFVAIKLHATISRGEKMPHGRYTLVITPDTRIAPFSWCRYIVMSRSDFETSGEVITLHETRHLDARHWVDLLLAQLVAIFQWYNPAAWLMREELKTVHEFQADEAVIRSGTDPRQYQMLLIKKAVGARFPSLANSLNHSKLKKRITMMYKSKSSTARRFRALALLPAGALALLATTFPAVASILSEASAAEVTVSTGKVTEIKAETQITATPLKGSVIKVTDKSDNNSSGTTIVTLSSNGRQSDLSDVDVYVNGEKQPAEKLSEINSDKIKSIDIKKGDNDKSTVYITMNSDKASQTTTQSTSITVKNDEPEKKSEKVATTVEQMPQYPGGDRALMEFVAKNVKYPEAAMKAGKEGKVIVRFTVQADGKVADANVIRSISPELDAEAVRVVSTFPAFTPGTVDGKPVACQYVIPISFKLSKDDATKTTAPEAAK